MATLDGKPITLDSNDGNYYYTNTEEDEAEALGTKDEVERMSGFIPAPAAAPPAAPPADTLGGRKRRGKKSRKSRKGKKPRKGKKSRKNKRRTKRR